MPTFLYFDTANSDWDYTGMKYPPVAVSIRKWMSLFSFTEGSRWRVGGGKNRSLQSSWSQLGNGLFLVEVK